MSEINSQDRVIAPTRLAIEKRKLSWIQAAIVQLTLCLILWGVIFAVVAVF